MPQITLLTGYDTKQQDIGVATLETKCMWARKVGIPLNVSSLPGRFHPSFNKLEAVYSLLDHYDSVIWMDADVLVTNMNGQPPMPTAGFHASRDWAEDSKEEKYNFSCGAFLATRSARGMIRRAILKGEKWGNTPLWDQGALRQVAESAKAGVIMHDRRVFNAVPEEVAPGRVLEPWQPGDWLCHITEVPQERKLEIFDRIYHQIVGR